MKDPSPSASEITPKELFFSRRNALRAAALVVGSAATAGVYRALNQPAPMPMDSSKLPGLISAPPLDDPRGFRVDEPQTSRMNVANYNNFYEFTTDKDAVAASAKDFVSKPWQVVVDGLVHAPRTFDLDDLRRLAPPEERIYRMRCVEAWSMVIPWAGLPLAKLIQAVEPMTSARYVAFATLLDPRRMPGQKTAALDWPYLEGLRLDEAMHPLALLATGIYGEELPPQNGAPVRLVVPWKYGFKGIKSIVRISLTDVQPPSTWNRQAPGEYGFFANVNPDVPHPRWSQATEQRIGESGRRPTLMFNGYGAQVASLYGGMDLRANY